VTTPDAVNIFEPDSQESPSSSWASSDLASHGPFSCAAQTDALLGSSTGVASLWVAQQSRSGATTLATWSQDDQLHARARRTTLHAPAARILVTTFALREDANSLPSSIVAVEMPGGGKKKRQAKQRAVAMGSKAALNVVLVAHSTGDVSAFHAGTLSPIKTWSGVLSPMATKAEGKGAAAAAALLLWCTAPEFSSSASLAEHGKDRNGEDVSGGGRGERLGQLIAKEQSLVESHGGDTAGHRGKKRADAAAGAGVGGSSGAVTLLALQHSNGDSGEATLHVLRLELPAGQTFSSKSATDAASATPASSSLSSSSPAAWSSQLVLNRFAAHTLLPPLLPPCSSLQLAASFAHRTLALVWSPAATAVAACSGVLQTLALPTLSTHFDATPRLTLNTPIGCPNTLQLPAPPSSPLFLVASLGPSHVAVLDAAGGLSVVDANLGIVLASSSSSPLSASSSLPVSLEASFVGGGAAGKAGDDDEDAAPPSSSSSLFAVLTTVSSSSSSVSAARSASKKSSAKKQSLAPPPLVLCHEVATCSVLVNLAPHASANPQPGTLAACFGAAVPKGNTTFGSGVAQAVQPTLTLASSAFSRPRSSALTPSFVEGWFARLVGPAVQAEAALVKAVAEACARAGGGDGDQATAAFSAVYDACLKHAALGAGTAAAAVEQTNKANRKRSASSLSSRRAAAAAACSAMGNNLVAALVCGCALALSKTVSSPTAASVYEGALSDLIASQRLSGRVAFPTTRRQGNETSAGEAAGGERLVPLLLRLRRFRLVEQCLLCCVDLPEADVVRALRCVLSGLDDQAACDAVLLTSASASSAGSEVAEGSAASKKKRKAQKSQQGEAVPAATLAARAVECRVVAAERILACAMGGAGTSGGQGDESGEGARARPRRPAGGTGAGFMRAAVSSLDARETTVVFLVLRRLLGRVTRGEVSLGLHEEAVSKESGLRVTLPSVSSVCEWCAALLDAHFTTLVLGSAASASPLAPCLRSLASLLASELAGVECCGDVGQRLASVMAESKRRTEDLRRQAALLEGGGSNASQYKQAEEQRGSGVEYTVELLCI